MSAPRVLLYSHDSFGLGHIRRTLALARAISEADSEASVLILTGSTVACCYRLPPRVDTVKLPVITKNAAGAYESLRLPIEFEDVRALRSAVALAAAKSFRPTVAVVDKTPLGVRGEIRATLEWLRHQRGCRLVLGLRDIEDGVEKVRAEWSQLGLRSTIERYYDTILVYGPESSMDALDCLGWDDLPVPVHHVGYVCSSPGIERPPDFPSEYLLATTGGGADGLSVLVNVIEALRIRPLPLPTVIVTGPLITDRDFAGLIERTAGLNIRVHEFRADMESVVAGAKGVVSMAGYNTVAEVLGARKRALLVPRIVPREEQLLRARALAEQGLIEMLHPAELSPSVMREALDRLLTRPAPAPEFVLDQGAVRAAGVIRALAAADQTSDAPLLSPAFGAESGPAAVRTAIPT